MRVTKCKLRVLKVKTPKSPALPTPSNPSHVTIEVKKVPPFMHSYDAAHEAFCQKLEATRSREKNL